jgi:hypothetical protein
MWRTALKVTAAVAFLALMMAGFGDTHSVGAAPPQPSTDNWDVVFSANPATAGVPVYGDADALIENGESQKVEVHMSIDTLNLAGLGMTYQAYFDLASNVYSGFLPVGAFGLRNQSGVPSTAPEQGDTIPGDCAAVGWVPAACKVPQSITPVGAVVGSITYSVMTNLHGVITIDTDLQPFMCGDDNGDTVIDGNYVGPITAPHYGGTTFAQWSGAPSFPPESLGGKCPNDGHVPADGVTPCFAGTQYVQGFDDDDDDGLAGSIDGNDGGDMFSEAQSSARGDPTMIDGAEFMISWIPDFIRSVGLDPIFISRSYGVAQTVPGKSHSDVSFMFFDTAPTPEPQGIVEFTTVGGSPFGIPEAETSITCPPFTSTTIFQGLAGNGREDGAGAGTCVDGIDNGGGDGFDRKDPDCAPMSIIASAPGAINSDKIIMSRNEDADADGVAVPYDLCRTMTSVNVTAGWAAWDADRDGIGNECDTTVLGTLGPNTADTADFDADGWLNTIDNCPTVANPDQIDADSDSIGNVCDPAWFTPGLGQGWAGKFNDSDDICEDEWTEADSEVLFTPAPSDVDEYPPTYTGKGLPAAGTEDRYCANWLVPGAIMDSNDNMVPDYVGAPLQAPPLGDKDSDSDYDGCSDWDESANMQGAALSPCGTDALNHNTDGDALMDGLEDTDASTVIDMKENDPNPDYSANPSAKLDMDGDGCSMLEELTRNKPGDPFSPWDFFDVPTPAILLACPGGVCTTIPKRDGTAGGITTDVQALLKYSGAKDTGTDPRYNVDLDANTIQDGIEYDRSALPTAQGTWPGAPDGTAGGITTDVQAMLAQAGMKCLGAGLAGDSIEIFYLPATATDRPDRLVVVGWGWSNSEDGAGDRTCIDTIDNGGGGGIDGADTDCQVQVTCTWLDKQDSSTHTESKVTRVVDGLAGGATGLITVMFQSPTKPIGWALCQAVQRPPPNPFISMAWKFRPLDP